MEVLLRWQQGYGVTPWRIAGWLPVAYSTFVNLNHNHSLESGSNMVSKCLNSNCSTAFHSLGQGRLYRVDFNDAGKMNAQAGRKTVASIRSKSSPIEHFWLCESCAASMTLQLTAAGEVRLVPLKPVVPKHEPVSVGRDFDFYEKRGATAS